jgi:hypothetical protein
MDEPLAEWLALREPADARARSASITAALAPALPARRPLRILDLGTGTGSNIRYLTPRLPGPQKWLAVDRDASLLAMLPHGVESRRLELGSLDVAELFADRDLVTASALLDLVSERWIRDLAAQCRTAGAAVLFALNYDGRSACDPPDADDDVVRDLFNAHQRSNDKGFGTAAGPDAATCAIACFESSGYVVRHDRSDWNLGPGDAAMQRLLIRGWAEAAIEKAPVENGRIRSWLQRRLEHVTRQQSRIVVGHEDVAAWLQGPR